MTDADDMKRLEAMKISMDLRNESMRAQFDYRNRAVQELLQRIEDCVRLVEEKDYDEKEALSMIEKQCIRIRLIEAELRK